ncbi:MAG TPA: hypothetical protein VGI60_07980 [Chthoniobacterales bacterium]
MNIDLTKLVSTVKNTPIQAKLAAIALAIVAPITRHQDLRIVLPLVGILAVIVFWLIGQTPRRH